MWPAHTLSGLNYLPTAWLRMANLSLFPSRPRPKAQCPAIVSVSARVPTMIVSTGFFSVALGFINSQLAVQEENSSSKFLFKILGRCVLDFPSPVSVTAMQRYADRGRGPGRQQTD